MVHFDLRQAAASILAFPRQFMFLRKQIAERDEIIKQREEAIRGREATVMERERMIEFLERQIASYEDLLRRRSRAPQ